MNHEDKHNRGCNIHCFHSHALDGTCGAGYEHRCNCELRDTTPTPEKELVWSAELSERNLAAFERLAEEDTFDHIRQSPKMVDIVNSNVNSSEEPPTTEEWEEEFDREFPHMPGLYNTESGWKISDDPKRFKSFIHSLLASERARAREEEQERIINILNDYYMTHQDQGASYEWLLGRSALFKELKSLIRLTTSK